jgi:subtilase family serine protease
VPYPNAATPKATDLGPLSAHEATTPLSVTVALGLRNLSEAEKLLQSVNTPGDPQFRQFLTAEQFVSRFAPSDTDVAKVMASLAKYGLTCERTTPTTLKVTGLPANLERAFAVSLHSYSVPARGNAVGYNFHAPLSHPVIPAEIASAVSAVVGLDSRPSLHPLQRSAPATRLPATSPATLPSTQTTTGNPFEYLTVTDFANYYDVEPLYKRGILGTGRTLGILTFASFTPSDAFAYWSAAGLSVNSNRIKIVNIDGGPGAPNDAAGSLETTIDVEQSGGVAPGANILVYQAPNTSQAFVDVFASAIDANIAETLSISWGEWEWFDNLKNTPVTDPATGKTVSTTQAVHELLVRAGVQGQSVYAASGDGGAYEANDDLGCFGPYSSKQPASCSLTLSVDYPASDPAITAAGGTTLAFTQEYCLNAACTETYAVNVPDERVWGWDYLDGFCSALGYSGSGFAGEIACGIFSGGSGGGVSVTFALPSYQTGLSGIQRSLSGQTFKTGSDNGNIDYALPANYLGRNVPDVSFNADPDTGYVVYYTSSVNGYGVESGWGGTSFVAPQLNGVSALLGEYVNGRIGLINYSLYKLALGNKAYSGVTPPLHAIAYGDNWYYRGRDGYNPGSGLGTIDVANFAGILLGEF